MKTEDLIAGLGRDATPVPRLGSPGRRAGRWLVGAALYLAAFGVLALSRNASGLSSEPVYLLQQGASAAVAVAAALAAFTSTVPGRPRLGWMPVAAAAVWAVAVIAGCAQDLRAVGTLGFLSQSDWPCVVSMTAGGGILWALAAVMLKSGAPLTPRATAALGAAAALGVANIEACLTRGHAFDSVILLWHGGTAALLLALAAWSGPSVFSWRAALGRSLGPIDKG